MAIKINKRRFYADEAQPSIQPVEPPKPAVTADDIEALKQRINEQSIAIERLAQPKPRVDVVATIRRDNEGRMESIIIKG